MYQARTTEPRGLVAEALLERAAEGHVGGDVAGAVEAAGDAALVGELRAQREVLRLAVVGEAPLVRAEDVLAARELELGAAQRLGGVVGLAGLEPATNRL